MAAATDLIPEPAPAIAAIAIRPEHIVRVFFTDGEVHGRLANSRARALMSEYAVIVIYASLERSAHSAHIRALIMSRAGRWLPR